MSESVYEPNPGDGDNDGAVDIDTAFGEDGVDELIDRSYSPPEAYRESQHFGTTVQEQQEGESFEQRLAQEEPDPSEARDGGLDGVLDDGEVGDARAGRLVDPDEGLGEDIDKDLIGQDVGIDAGAASAEEAAMHIVGETEGDWRLEHESGRPEY